MNRLTHAIGAPIADNFNAMNAGPRGPALLQDIWLIEKLAHFDRGVIPERRMHAKGSGAFGTFTNLTDDEACDRVGRDRESAQRDLFDAIERGDYPRWTMYVQMTPNERQRLFGNTASSMAGISLEIREPDIANCAKADPAYGAGIALALGLTAQREAA